MSLPIDERLIQMQSNLEQDIRNIVVQKQQLLEQFKNYALQKYKQLGKPFKIKYRFMNGSPSMGYANLNIGDEMNLEMVSFEYNPKTNIVNGHTTNIFKGKKLVADFSENLTIPSNSYNGKIKDPHPLEKTSDFDKEKVTKEIETRVNNILMGILEGKLVFNDNEYKRLVATNIALEQELDRLNTRLSALQIINSSSNIELEEPAKTM